MAARSPRIRFLWITDPWETLDHAKDTTLRLAQESLSLGHENYWTDVKSIRRENSRTLLTAVRILDAGDRQPGSFVLGPSRNFAPDQFQKLSYRTDPPVDLAYLHPLQILQMGLDSSKGAELINPAEVLFFGNEKLEGTVVHGLSPPTLASSEWDHLQSFGKREGRVVLKPLHEAQSKGVELLDFRNDSGTQAARAALEKITAGFQIPVLLQRFLEGIAEGEQRLWFLDGKLLACVRKRPKNGEFKIDMDRGGFLSPTRLNAQEKRAADKVGKHLRTLKVRLAAVDLIEAKVTDFNLTSPGLLTPMEGILGLNLARPVIERLARPWK